MGVEPDGVRAGRPPTREQRVARHAYERVAILAKEAKERRSEYETAVNDLGVGILRGGLCAALATLERRKERGGRLVLEHLAGAGLLGLEGATADTLSRRVRDLDQTAYIRVTREALRTAAWLKRAVQSMFEEG